jgi:hypothetical protein
MQGIAAVATALLRGHVEVALLRGHVEATLLRDASHGRDTASGGCN